MKVDLHVQIYTLYLLALIDLSKRTYRAEINYANMFLLSVDKEITVIVGTYIGLYVTVVRDTLAIAFEPYNA